MKTLFAGVTVVLGLMLVIPTQAEAQECRICHQKLDNEQGFPPPFIHQFDSEGQFEDVECAASSDLPEDESAPSGPAMKHLSCFICHNDWLDGDCFENHDFCLGQDGQAALAAIEAEVDHLVSFLGSVINEAAEDPASKLVTRVAATTNLSVDRTRGTLKLSDCAGRLITEWSVPKAVLKMLAETN